MPGGYGRPKRVTDPFDDKVRARLVGEVSSYVSSGSSEHSREEEDFPCLSALVHSFFEEGEQREDESQGCDSDSDRVDSVHDCSYALQVIVRATAVKSGDSYRSLLLAHVLKAVEVMSFFRTQKAVFNRKVMAYLRELGHNAAICKTKWSSSGSLAAGNYEFIDVVQSVSSDCQNRYFIDLDFASEYEIARPTAEYTKLLQILPKIFVGKSEKLKKIVKVMSDSAKNSLKSRDLSLPPWRKNRYMQTKWFGPFRRTVNQISTNSLTPAISHANAVKCRYVGFDDAVNSSLFVRTR